MVFQPLLIYKENKILLKIGECFSECLCHQLGDNELCGGSDTAGT